MKALLRHKWTLALITLLPWTAAAFYYFLSTPPYVSEAKLLVRYVIEPEFLSPAQRAYLADKSNRIDPMVKPEMDVLTSRELAEEVVEEVGLRRLAPKGGESAARSSLIARGLTVSAEKGSCVIRITFKHADAETAQATLQTLIDAYLRKHLRVHRTAAAPGVLRQEFPKSRALLSASGVFGRSAAKLEADGLRESISVPNIAVLQQPTSGLQDTKRRKHILLGLIVGGPVLGILVALGSVRQQRSVSPRIEPPHAPPT